MAIRKPFLEAVLVNCKILLRSQYCYKKQKVQAPVQV